MAVGCYSGTSATMSPVRASEQMTHRRSARARLINSLPVGHPRRKYVSSVCCVWARACCRQFWFTSSVADCSLMKPLAAYTSICRIVQKTLQQSSTSDRTYVTSKSEHKGQATSRARACIYYLHKTFYTVTDLAGIETILLSGHGEAPSFARRHKIVESPIRESRRDVEIKQIGG